MKFLVGRRSDEGELYISCWKGNISTDELMYRSVRLVEVPCHNSQNSRVSPVNDRLKLRSIWPWANSSHLNSSRSLISSIPFTALADIFLCYLFQFAAPNLLLIGTTGSSIAQSLRTQRVPLPSCVTLSITTPVLLMMKATRSSIWTSGLRWTAWELLG
jgi:hypothetical protein